MTPHFWSSCLYLLSSGIIEVSHNALFMWHWGSNSELCTRQVNILPTEMQSQLYFLEGFSLYSRLTSNFKSSCLSFSITGSIGIRHHTHLSKAFFKQLYSLIKKKPVVKTNKQIKMHWHGVKKDTSLFLGEMFRGSYILCMCQHDRSDVKVQHQGLSGWSERVRWDLTANSA